MTFEPQQEYSFHDELIFNSILLSFKDDTFKFMIPF